MYMPCSKCKPKGITLGALNIVCCKLKSPKSRRRTKISLYQASPLQESHLAYLQIKCHSDTEF